MLKYTLYFLHTSLICSHVPVNPTIAGWNSARYSASTPGVSRAGSQVMKMGKRGGRRDVEVELGEERSGEALTRSIIVAILSSSSGQISGQWEKPKYTYHTHQPNFLSLSQRFDHTHQTIPPLHIRVPEFLPPMIHKGKRPSNLRPSHPLRRLCDPQPIHAVFLIPQIKDTPRARRQKQHTCLPRERAAPISRALLLYSLISPLPRHVLASGNASAEW